MRILKLLFIGMIFSSTSLFAQEVVKKEVENDSDLSFSSKRGFKNDWSISLRAQNTLLFGDVTGLSKYFNNDKWDTYDNLTEVDKLDLGFGLRVAKSLNSKFDLGVELGYGKMSGLKDIEGNYPYTIWKSEADMMQADLNLRWYLSKYILGPSPKVLGFLDIAAGYGMYDVKSFQVAHKDISVDDKIEIEDNFSSVLLGFGGGFEFKLFKKLSLELGTKWFMANDDVDGLSFENAPDVKDPTLKTNPYNDNDDSYWLTYVGVGIDLSKNKGNSLSHKWGIGELLAPVTEPVITDTVIEIVETVDTVIKVEEVKDTVVVEKEVIVEEIIIDHSIVQFNPVFFDYDKSDIRNDQMSSIEEVALYLKKYPEVKVNLTSHTDKRGSVEYNQKLSEKRALSVKKMLVEKYGINEDRIEYFPKGKSELKYDKHDLNRRVDFNLRNGMSKLNRVNR